jgi:hypothetical protein
MNNGENGDTEARVNVVNPDVGDEPKSLEALKDESSESSAIGAHG